MPANGSDSSTPMHIGSQGEWAQWLAQHYDKSSGVWVRHARKGAPEASVTHAEALEVARTGTRCCSASRPPKSRRRARRIAQFAAMLARGETIYP